MSTGAQSKKALRMLRWLPAYAWQRATRHTNGHTPVHLIIAVADHFEPGHVPDAPAGTFAAPAEQMRRLARWCEAYPRAVSAFRDSDGRPFRHTYFYPGEQYERAQIELLAEHCRNGWGEIEVHLHHGVEAPDTAAATRRALLEFRDALVAHGCLSRWDGAGSPRYAFVHGNWALANSNAGRFCGVDDEMQILAETGCYADMSLPAAPDPAQVAKINSLYECALPLTVRAPHRRGHALRVGRTPQLFPLIVQGPLGLNFARRIAGLPVPYIENSALTTNYPPTMHRLALWRRAAITVADRPDWLFIKLHCHGMDQRDERAMLGDLIQDFLRELTDEVRRTRTFFVHFTTAREMVNLILAACDGRAGEPRDFFDYRLRLITPSAAA
jgi:hypothetical protein